MDHRARRVLRRRYPRRSRCLRPALAERAARLPRGRAPSTRRRGRRSLHGVRCDRGGPAGSPAECSRLRIRHRRPRGRMRGRERRRRLLWRPFAPLPGDSSVRSTSWPAWCPMCRPRNCRSCSATRSPSSPRCRTTAARTAPDPASRPDRRARASSAPAERSCSKSAATRPRPWRASSPGSAISTSPCSLTRTATCAASRRRSEGAGCNTCTASHMYRGHALECCPDDGTARCPGTRRPDPLHDPDGPDVRIWLPFAPR